MTPGTYKVTKVFLCNNALVTTHQRHRLELARSCSAAWHVDGSHLDAVKSDAPCSAGMDPRPAEGRP